MLVKLKSVGHSRGVRLASHAYKATYCFCFINYRAVQPPSTKRLEPVTMLEAGEAR